MKSVIIILIITIILAIIPDKSIFKKESGFLVNNSLKKKVIERKLNKLNYTHRYKTKIPILLIGDYDIIIEKKNRNND